MFGPRQLALGLETTYYLPLHEIRYVMVHGQRMPDVQPAKLTYAHYSFCAEDARTFFADQMRGHPSMEDRFEYWVREGRPIVTLDDEGRWHYV